MSSMFSTQLPKSRLAPATQRANLSMKPVKVNACERAGCRALGTSPHEGTQGLAAVTRVHNYLYVYIFLNIFFFCCWHPECLKVVTGCTRSSPKIRVGYCTFRTIDSIQKKSRAAPIAIRRHTASKATSCKRGAA